VGCARSLELDEEPDRSYFSVTLSLQKVINAVLLLIGMCWGQLVPLIMTQEKVPQRKKKGNLMLGMEGTSCCFLDALLRHFLFHR
jgi:hypothetical protein